MAVRMGCAGSATSHTMTPPAALPVASSRPSGRNATACMLLADRRRPMVRVAVRAGRAGSVTSHKLTSPSPSAVPLTARSRPSGLNPTAHLGIFRRRRPMVRVAVRAGRAGSVTFHKLTPPSVLALASSRPSGLKPTACTLPRWPVIVAALTVGWGGRVADSGAISPTRRRSGVGSHG